MRSGFYQLVVMHLSNGCSVAFIGEPGIDIRNMDIKTIRISSPKPLEPGDTLDDVLAEFIERNRPPPPPEPPQYLRQPFLRSVFTGITKPFRHKQ